MASEIPLLFWGDGNIYQPPFQGAWQLHQTFILWHVTLSIISTLTPQILQQENEKQSYKLPKLLTQTLLANIDEAA